MDITPREARRLFLHRQGLLRADSFGRGRNAVARAVEQLGYVQIDTISVVDRAHHHALKTRVPNYGERMLDELQWRHRAIFEYWIHAAAYLPIDDYRFCRPIMNAIAGRSQRHPKLAREILNRIREEGPLQSRDFKDSRPRKSAGWWDWKPAKRALEQLYLAGELMVVRRHGFQKVYDLPDRVLPAGVDTRTPHIHEWCRFLVCKMIRALGIATINDIAYPRATIRKLSGHDLLPGIRNALADLVAEGGLAKLDLGNETWYAHDASLDELPLRARRRTIKFLSPFDNLIINRDRTRRLFGFDYQLECYVPRTRRRYGYFCLPILYGDALIGRMDSTANRAGGEFQVHSLLLEPGTRCDDRLVLALETELADFARRHQCTSIEIGRTEPASLRSRLRAKNLQGD